MSYSNPTPRKSSRRLSTSVRLGAAAVAACFISAQVYANPVNPTVVSGAASFSQTANVLTVTNSNGAIINWDKFSIKAGETTHFAQTAASSSVMNRVLNDPTAIYGTLSSNGRVFLVNPAGIMVGPGGRVDTAGFVASTLNIRNEDFLAGRNLFVNDGSARDIINQGEIRTPAGGSVYLIGSNVSNEGIITTPKGETILAAGATVSLIDSATPGVKVDITGAAGNSTNLGEITAEAGRIGIAGVIARNSGTLNASSVVNEGGRIFLRASQDAYVDGNGRIVTTGTRGGKVEVLGNRVAVMDNASIDASGSNGGGRILVGGDYQGKNPEVQNADISYFGPGASLRADATGVGAGGTVIVWADDTTRAYGSISARGGAAGGDGGFVETSGKRYLDITGARVDTRAPNGHTGNWLLDPVDVTIAQYGGSPTSGSAPFAPTTNASVIWAEDISIALGSTSVTIQTDGGAGGNGHITANGVSIGGPNSLTLAAYGGGGLTDGNINITGSNINVGGGFKALAGWDGIGFDGSNVVTGTGNINISGSFINASGNIDLHAGNDITLGHTGTGPGTWIQSNGQMSVSANNLSLLGGSGGIWNFSSPQGPGVTLRGNGGQTIAVVNQILLQAGSFNNTAYAGSPQYGGSVSIDSGGAQDISANIIKVYAGLSGHDNGAQIQAYGSQSITITGTGGLLEVKGGGDGDLAVFGGAGSFNNQARIQHGQTYGGDVYFGTGVQTITIDGGGTVNVQAGNGTGELGYYSNECAAVFGVAACRGSSNGAQIENGLGAQTLDFLAAGFLTVTGGDGGTQNWAGVNNKGAGQSILGNPDITLSGGNSGGSGVGSGVQSFELSNDAGIFSKGSGSQFITAGNLTINAGNAAYGGAGIGSESGNALQIVTTGNLSMYGGGSSAGHPFASGAYIGSENDVAINLNIGGNLYVWSGSGTSSPVLIGSLDGTATVDIVVGGGATIVANGSGVGIGSGAPTNAGPNVGIGTGVSLTAAGGDVTISAGGDVGVGGSVTAVSGSISVDGGEGGYGGNIFVAGTLSGNSGVTLRAREAWLDGSKGHVDQFVGSIIGAPAGDIHISGGGDVTLDGSVTASNGIDIGAGFYAGGYYGEDSSRLGGNLIIGGILGSSFGDINLAANVGYQGYGKGDITQRSGSGSSIGGSGSIGIAAGGSVDLGGAITSSAGSLSVFAGNQAGYVYGYMGYGANGGYLTPNGGNISVAGTLSGNDGVSLFAEAGSNSGLNGHVTQSAGSISSGYGDIGIGGGGHVSLNGIVSSIFGYGTFIAAGTGYSGNPSQFGGNIVLGASSQIFGDHVELIASGGYNGGLGAGGESTGNITQLVGGILRATANNPPLDTLIAHAAGNVELLGTTIVDGGTPVMIQAGFDYPNDASMLGKHIAINSLNAAGSDVYLYATGQIFANTQNIAFIEATIDSNSPSGGIIVKNIGAAQPSSVLLYDYAPANSTVSFSHSGSDLTLDSSYYFSTFGNSGAILVAAPTHNLTYSGGGLYGGSSFLTAGNNLAIDSSLFAPGDIGLLAGNALTVNSGVHAGNNIGLVAPEIILNAGVTASGTTATPSVISNPATGAAVSFSGIGFIAKNLYADSASGYLKATEATGDVSGLVAGNITLKNGAYFQAGNDIDLTLAGAGSTLSLDNGSYLLADAATHVPTSIWLAFTSRSSGGVMIDGLETTKSVVGGSGLFVGDLNTPATDGAGLHLTYAAAKVTVDPCVTNPTLCKLPDLDKTPITRNTALPPSDTSKTDPTKPPEDLSKTTGGTEGSFGGEEGGKEEKKDEKDEKDKKSDVAKEEKKDEKPAQKKVAQCT